MDYKKADVPQVRVFALGDELRPVTWELAALNVEQMAEARLASAASRLQFPDNIPLQETVAGFVARVLSRKEVSEVERPFRAPSAKPR